VERRRKKGGKKGEKRKKKEVRGTKEHREGRREGIQARNPTTYNSFGAV
jgi:hypothetical protein